MDGLPQLFSEEEVAAYLKVKKDTVQTWRGQGKLSYYKLAGRYFYTLSDITEFIDGCRVVRAEPNKDKNTTTPDTYISRREAAEVLSVHLNTIDNFRKRGVLPLKLVRQDVLDLAKRRRAQAIVAQVVAEKEGDGADQNLQVL